MKEKITAIILAAGYGRRMNLATAKQYMFIKDKPMLYYSLKAFEESSVDEIILVTAKGETEVRENEYVKNYGFSKIKRVVEGGSERYHSVYEGLKAVDSTDYVLIHDGARPLITKELIEKTIICVIEKKACIIGVKSKDTIKLSNESGSVDKTINRAYAWIIQTPQAFSYDIILEAYQKAMNDDSIMITDDSMTVERYTKHPVYLLEGSYKNIKVTTQEDIDIVEAFLSENDTP